MSEAELLLRDGRYAEARLLLRAALDAEPASLPTLDTLGSLAEVSRLDESELFTRLEAAGDHADRWWRQLSYAVFFGRAEMTAAILPHVIGERPAAVGALLIELGRAREGERLLRSAATPAASYHLALYAASRGRHAQARAQLDELTAHPLGYSLGSIGKAFLDLERGAAASARRRLQSCPAETSARSEWMLFRVCLAIVEGRRLDAERAAGDLGNPPYESDPSAMLRAASLLGIACLARLSQVSPKSQGGPDASNVGVLAVVADRLR